MNRIKLIAVLAGIAIVGANVITGIAQAEEVPAGEVTTNTPTTSVEEPATEWDKTKAGSAKAWDKTKELSGDAWDATKEGSAKAWDATKEGSAKAWDKTKSTVQGWQETESETDSNQETPAPGQSP